MFFYMAVCSSLIFWHFSGYKLRVSALDDSSEDFSQPLIVGDNGEFVDGLTVCVFCAAGLHALTLMLHPDFKVASSGFFQRLI